MARFELGEYESFRLSIEELQEVPREVLNDMLAAQGEVIQEGQRKTASTMLRGPYYKGVVAGAVSVGKVRNSTRGPYLYVTFKGTRGKNRIAEIAFINEYGKTKQAPRAFIWTANEKNADAAVDATAKIYDEYLKSKGL